MKTVLYAVVTSGFLSITAFYLFPGIFGLTPKTNLAIFAFIFLALAHGWHRLMIFTVFPSGAQKIIVLGNSPLIKQTIEHIKSHPHIGYYITEWFKSPKDITLKKVLRIASQHDARLIVIQNRLQENPFVAKLVYRLLTHDINVTNFWQFYETVFEKVPLEELEKGWFVENVTAHRPFYNKAKRLIDMSFAAILLIVFSPLMILAILLVGFTSHGPVIYKAKRTGKNSKNFTLYKFRTMYNNHRGPLWTEQKDKRLTPVGRILRSSHLDELPQLFNILKGDISLIGPRPERVELVEKYKTLPYYDIRHIIKPGVTGWAQINYKPSASVEEAKEKLCYDIYYIKNQSLLLDTTILLRTIRYFFTAQHR